MPKKRVWISHTRIVFDNDQDFAEFLAKVKRSIPDRVLTEILSKGQAKVKGKTLSKSIIESTWVLNDVDTESLDMLLS